MDILLNEMEARIMGCLIEKQLATPDYYPLSLNALSNACNQKSNRDPVVSYTEQAVYETVDGLIQKGLAHESNVARVPKYEERLTPDLKLVAREASVLCVLLLRGPQTIGELRGRTARLYNFESLDEVHETLANLEEWGYTQRLPRMPGQKESRYTHLFCGQPEIVEAGTAPVPVSGAGPDTDRLEKIEQDIASLRNDLEDLKRAFKEFVNQF